MITVVAVVADLINDEAVQSSDNNDDDSGNSSMNTSKNTVHPAKYLHKYVPFLRLRKRCSDNSPPFFVLGIFVRGGDQLRSIPCKKK